MLPDFSTLDIARLKRLPLYKKPPTYYISDSMGAGCAGDPPGYPTYFLRSVYTRHGNSPGRGAQDVITLPNGDSYVTESSDDWRRDDTWETYRERIEKRLRRLWKPLALDHPRTQAWIADRIRYLKGCRIDPRKPVHSRFWCKSVDKEWGATDICEIARALGSEISEEYQVRMEDHFGDPNTSILSYDELEGLYDLVAWVLNRTDAASFVIREFYPEYEPTDPAPEYTGDWFETLPYRPTPEECPGEIRHRGHIWRHPVNITSCQVCGWNRKG